MTGKTFLIGCCHFGHKNIIRLCERPFETVEEMNRKMTENWNRVVKPDDRVIILGDFCFKGGQAEDYEDQLNGYKIRIQGNHDRPDWSNDHLVELAYSKKKSAILCHYPIEEWNQYFRRWPHFHAHTHSKVFNTAAGRGSVGADAIDFTPILIEEAVERIQW